MSNANQNLLDKIEAKMNDLSQDMNVHLEGLLWSKPITYWDYIQTDTLLTLQNTRTNIPDEMVFVMYHQINELLFKMMLWEIRQVAECQALTVSFFKNKLARVSRYFDMLSSSFAVMMDGMEVNQYLKFRTALTPASGFQSAQYRMVEMTSTERKNLIDNRFRANFDHNASDEYAFDYLYWQAAGVDHTTGKKSTLLSLFEEKYRKTLVEIMGQYKETNLWTKYKTLPEAERNNPELIASMRHYDYTVNIKWVMAHYHAAERYLQSDGEAIEATGGSDWRKYMLPRYQKRIFFPDLWTEEERNNWGMDV